MIMRAYPDDLVPSEEALPELIIASRGRVVVPIDALDAATSADVIGPPVVVTQEVVARNGSGPQYDKMDYVHGTRFAADILRQEITLGECLKVTASDRVQMFRSEDRAVYTRGFQFLRSRDNNSGLQVYDAEILTQHEDVIEPFAGSLDYIAGMATLSVITSLEEVQDLIEMRDGELQSCPDNVIFARYFPELLRERGVEMDKIWNETPRAFVRSSVDGESDIPALAENEVRFTVAVTYLG